MSRLLISTLALTVWAAVGLFSLGAEPASGERLSSESPPVVRSGDFAIELSEVLGLGAVDDEYVAQSRLAALGIAPRDGWIASYPVTPMILGELREAVIDSSETGRLAMPRVDALAAFDNLALDLGLSVDGSAMRSYSEAPPPGDLPPYGSPSGNGLPVDPYGYDAEPPILTYYPPPNYYYSFYDWTPYPFFFSGSFFPGFFILHDFHRVYKDRYFDHKASWRHGSHHRHDRKLISNQYYDRSQGRTVRIRPRTAQRADRFVGAFDRGVGRGSNRRNAGAATLDRLPAGSSGDDSGRGPFSSRRRVADPEAPGTWRRSARPREGSVPVGGGLEGRRTSGRSESIRGGRVPVRSLSGPRDGTFEERRALRSWSPGRGGEPLRAPDGFRRGESFRSIDAPRRGDSVRSSDSFGGRGFPGRSDATGRGGGESSGSFRSFDGGGSFRSFSPGWSGGSSGRGGGGFSSGGRGGGRGGR